MDLGISIALQQVGRYQSQLNAVSRSTSNATGAMTKSIEKSQSAWRSLQSEIPIVGRAVNLLKNPIVAVGAAIAGAGVALSGFITKAGQFEKTRVSFEVLIGDAELAEKTLSRLSDFAASTPFELPGINKAARQLLAFGTSAENVPDVLRRIGDVAAGIDIPLSDLSEIYGKIQTQGRVFAEDINQLTGRGIPIISELAKQFGVAGSEVRALVTSGEIGFPQIEKAFVSLTSEGGRFFNLMEKQSGTFEGLTSTLRDNLAAVQRDIGAKLLPVAKELVSEAIELTRRFRDFIKESGLIENVGRALSSVGAILSPLVSAFGSVVSDVADLVSELFSGLVPGLESAGGIASGVASGAISFLSSALLGVAEIIKVVTRAISSIIGFFQDYEEITIGLTAAIAANIVITKGLAVAQVAGRVVSLSFAAAQALLSGNLTRATAAMKLLGVSTVAQGAIMKAASIATKAFAVVTSLLSGGLKGAAASFRVFTAALIANPFTAIAVAIAGIIAALIAWERRTGKVGAIFNGTIAYIKTLFQNFAKGFALIAAGIAVAFQGIFELDFSKVRTGIEGLGRGIRAQTIDIAKGASDAFDKAYNERIEAHARKAAAKTGEALDDAKQKTGRAAFNIGNFAGENYANAFSDSVTKRIAEGAGILGALNDQFNSNAALLKGFTDKIAKLDTSKASEQVINNLRSQIQENLNSGLISPADAARLQSQLANRLKKITDPASGPASDSIKALEDQLKGLQDRINSISPNSSAIAKIKSDIDGLKDKIASAKLQQIEISAKASIDTEKIDSAIKRLRQIEEINIGAKVDADTSAAQKNIESILSKLKKIKGADIDIKTKGINEVSAQIDSLSGKIKGIDSIKISIESGNISEAINQIENLDLSAKVKLKPDIIDIESLKVNIEATGINAITSQVEKLKSSLSEIETQIIVESDKDKIKGLQNQAESLFDQIQVLNNLKIDLSGESVPALTEKVSALQAVLSRLNPGPAFDQIIKKVQVANSELASAQLFRLDSQIQSFDTLSDKLRILQGLSNKLGPTDPQFASVVREIEEVKHALEILEARKVLISVGISIDPNNIIIPRVNIPAVELSAKLKIDSNVPQFIEPINELNSAANALGFSFQFANKTFRNTSELMRVASTDAFNFMTALGATSDQAAVFALGLEALKEQVQRALVEGVANSFRIFGEEIGKALKGGASATAAFAALFKSLLSVILAEVPKLVGMFLLQSAVAAGPPLGIPLALAGIGLVAFSGVAAGLLSQIGSANQQFEAPTAAQITAQGAQRQVITQTGGLSGLNAEQEQRQTVINNTIVIESDGIITELERRQIISNENRFGG